MRIAHPCAILSSSFARETCFLKFFRTSVYGRDETGQDARMEEGTSSFLRKQKYSMLKNVQGRTFLSGVFRGGAPKQCGKKRGL